jgi:hypothetical protein
MHCGATSRDEAEAACDYLCEMTYGYENKAFEDVVSMLHNILLICII